MTRTQSKAIADREFWGNVEYERLVVVGRAVDAYLKEKASMGTVTDVVFDISPIAKEHTVYHNQFSTTRKYYHKVLCPSLAHIYTRHRVVPNVFELRKSFGKASYEICTYLDAEFLRQKEVTDAQVNHLTEFLRTGRGDVWWVPSPEE